MEEAALKAERHVLGADQELAGTIRIGTSELLGGYLLQRPLGEFLAATPRIIIEIDVANRQVDLSRREADFAVRATPAPPDSLIGRKVGELRYAVYAAPRSLPRDGSPVDLNALPWIGFDERLSLTDIGRWFAATLPSADVRIRSDSFGTILRMAVEGIGAVVLPIFAAAQEPSLLRITPPIPGQSMALWLLNHPDTLSNARVAALSRNLAGAIPRELDRLMQCEEHREKLTSCPRPASRSNRRRRA